MKEFANLNAADVMSTQVIRISSLVTLREAGTRLVDDNLRCLLIEPEDPSRSPGIITVKDLVRVVGETTVYAIDDVLVADAMSCPVITVPVHLCIPDCIHLMEMTGVRTVFVTEGAQVVGQLSFSDIARVALHSDSE